LGFPTGWSFTTHKDCCWGTKKNNLPRQLAISCFSGAVAGERNSYINYIFPRQLGPIKSASTVRRIDRGSQGSGAAVGRGERWMGLGRASLAVVWLAIGPDPDTKTRGLFTGPQIHPKLLAGDAEKWTSSRGVFHLRVTNGPFPRSTWTKTNDPRPFAGHRWSFPYTNAITSEVVCPSNSVALFFSYFSGYG
jgi:hypothetical protein